MTAARIGWDEVSPEVRAALEQALGSAVVEVRNQAGGYSPSLAARCRLADGRRVFLKAVSTGQNPQSPGMLRHEIRVAPGLPAGVPAPRLLASYDDGDWVAAAFEDIDGSCPPEPWRQPDLAAVLAALDRLATAGDPAPPGLPTFAERYGDTLTGWRTLAADPPPDLDAWSATHLERLAELEAGWPAASAGTVLVHSDIRADNVVLDRQSQVWLVDWASACVGAPWIDLVLMLPSVALAGGPEPEDLWQSRRWAATVEPDAVTAVVAALAGYFTQRAGLPPPPGIPNVRRFQAAQGQVTRAWLHSRAF